MRDNTTPNPSGEEQVPEQNVPAGSDEISDQSDDEGLTVLEADVSVEDEKNISTHGAAKSPKERLGEWLTATDVAEPEATEIEETETVRKHPWWQVMCLTGVDYYSTLGYLPAIAVAAAGAVAPIAMLIIVALTLGGMVPVYRIVAKESPHGQGSVAMLEHILEFWKGKLLVLVLLGFVGTAWFITITLSSADATAHVVENPLFPDSLHYPILITLVFILALGAVFLKGFKEAISVAIVLVVVYLSLNLVIVVGGMIDIIGNPEYISRWQDALFESHANPLLILGVALLVFPQLALGISGFETGVGMMPLVRGDKTDTPDKLTGRIRNTRKMLFTAAVIMAVYLIFTSIVSTLLIPAEEFDQGGKAKGRALAFIAHRDFGEVFGTVYDISTVAILWFAGASAMAGLLNIVPRYLPHYGMAPDWARLTRPLVILNTAIACALTIYFRADVDTQASAYATGVLAMMSFASFAVFLYARRARQTAYMIISALTFLVVVYALVVNEIQKPEGLLIAAVFALGIILVSFLSRIFRLTELRTERIFLDSQAFAFVAEADTDNNDEINIIAHRPHAHCDIDEYGHKEREQRLLHHLETPEKVLFLEITVGDASDFSNELHIRGETIGDHRVLRGTAPSVPNAIAAFALHAQVVTGKQIHCYFDWTEGNPLIYLFKYLLFGQGETAPVAREILREAEPDPAKRPRIHVG